jgi:hypothetical protein
MAITYYPKPTDVIPYGEQDPKKSLTITNKTGLIINIGQMNSTWDQVRFVITKNKKDSEEKTKWIADLYPDDTIELFFNPAKPIQK